MADSFAWSVALRHLRYGIGQTLLTVGVVAISVTLIIFLNALIGGLQRRLISSVTGAIPHVVVRQPERVPVAAWDLDPSPGAPLYVGTTVKLERQKRKIEDWAEWLPRLETFDTSIIAVSPVVEGAGFVSRGAKRNAVTITGMLPERHNRVVDIGGKLVAGRFFGLNAGEAVVGYKLAGDFGIALGDKLRLTSDEGGSGTYTIVGIFDTGFSAVDSETVYLTLSDAQSLFALGRAVTSLGVKLDGVFAADDLARRLALQVPYETVPWTRDNQTLLSGLRAQSQSSNLILVFTTVAAGFGIASILITSVMSKLREIGILKAMGATQGQIIRVFALEGTLLALLGGVAGAAQGVGLGLLLLQFRQTSSATGREAEVFPMALDAPMVLKAVAVAVVVGFLASLYPAWRAARVNPMEVIRST